MPLMAHENRTELLASLVELSRSCPLLPGNPESCPLFALRSMRMTERWQWINALSDEDLMYLAAYHHVCLRVKMDTRTKRQGRGRPRPPSATREKRTGLQRGKV
jgi:hypothetical protein